MESTLLPSPPSKQWFEVASVWEVYCEDNLFGVPAAGNGRMQYTKRVIFRPEFRTAKAWRE